MDSEAQRLHLNHFIEEMAIIFESEGLPRMYGRVIGHLLVCDPPEQSSAELADALTASRGAISQATRALLQMGLIQRVPKPGSRAMYFEMRPDALDQMLHGAIARIRIAREHAERGLALLAHAPEERRKRLQAFRDVYAFMEEEYPKLLERWDRTRQESK